MPTSWAPRPIVDASLGSYSPDDVIADDVIRDEVDRLPPTRQVVVVTNDQEIVRDVRAMGANTISSDQLIRLIR
ncbi:MAG: NYN domain-containing protein [Ilumatobacteraceae bacterium]